MQLYELNDQPILWEGVIILNQVLGFTGYEVAEAVVSFSMLIWIDRDRSFNIYFKSRRLWLIMEEELSSS